MGVWCQKLEKTASEREVWTAVSHGANNLVQEGSEWPLGFAM